MMITHVAAYILASAGFAAGTTQCVDCTFTDTGYGLTLGSSDCEDTYNKANNDRFARTCPNGCQKTKSQYGSRYRRGCASSAFTSGCSRGNINILGMNTDVTICQCRGDFCNNAPRRESSAIPLLVALLPVLKVYV